MYAEDIVRKFNTSRGEDPLVRVSDYKITGYRLINYVPVEVFYPMKLYYEAFKKEKLDM